MILASPSLYISIRTLGCPFIRVIVFRSTTVRCIEAISFRRTSIPREELITISDMDSTVWNSFSVRTRKRESPSSNMPPGRLMFSMRNFRAISVKLSPSVARRRVSVSIRISSLSPPKILTAAMPGRVSSLDFISWSANEYRATWSSAVSAIVKTGSVSGLYRRMRGRSAVSGSMTVSIFSRTSIRALSIEVSHWNSTMTSDTPARETDVICRSLETVPSASSIGRDTKSSISSGGAPSSSVCTVNVG